MPTNIFLSIIICTRNRASKLSRALAHWQKVDFSGFDSEIVIVNNGSTDNTASVINDFIKDPPAHTLVIDEALPGLGRARKQASLAANGSILFFTDDDCYPLTDILFQIKETFSDPAVGYSGGRVLLYNPDHYKITTQVSNVHVEIEPLSYIPAGLIHGANMSFRASLVHAAGGFDERLGAGTCFFSGEDVDMLSRVSALGWKGVYNPSIVVYHDHGRVGSTQIRSLLKGYDIGRGAYYCKALLNPITRRKYLKHWYYSMRYTSYRTILHELKGCCLWLIAEATAKCQRLK